jgi:hypothetical protein
MADAQIHLFDRRACVLDICEPCWLYAAAETVEDPEMVFGSAELSLYEPSHDLEEMSR